MCGRPATGYFGGQAFEEKWWVALLLGLAIALAVAGLIELGRKLTGNETKISEKREELKET